MNSFLIPAFRSGVLPNSLIKLGWHIVAFIANRRKQVTILSLGCTFSLISAARGSESGDMVSVYSSVSPGYTRTASAGGTFKPETYAFGEGGDQGGVLKDLTIDNLRFIEIAHLIAPSLAAKNYLPCASSDPEHTDLLIMVYWGTTIGTDGTSGEAEYQIAQSLIPPPMAPMSPAPSGNTSGGNACVNDPATLGRNGEAQAASALKNANDSALQQSLLMTEVANRKRDRQNAENAAILGYVEELKRVEAYKMTTFYHRVQDVVDEVSETRYFVVLMAYDFQQLMQHKEKKLLWETRFSIRQRHNDFGKELAAMSASASRYFGQDSAGLKRNSMRDEHINLGEFKILRVEADRK